MLEIISNLHSPVYTAIISFQFGSPGISHDVIGTQFQNSEPHEVKQLPEAPTAEAVTVMCLSSESLIFEKQLHFSFSEIMEE